jgi:regulator of sirC expression with transglutaminase-like and TPR domain
MDQLLAFCRRLPADVRHCRAANQFFFQDLNFAAMSTITTTDNSYLNAVRKRRAAFRSRWRCCGLAGHRPGLNARGEFPGTMVKVNLPIQVVIDPFNGQSLSGKSPSWLEPYRQRPNLAANLTCRWTVFCSRLPLRDIIARILAQLQMKSTAHKETGRAWWRCRTADRAAPNAWVGV